MTIFTELSLIILLATVLAAIFKYFKQPMVIAYILAGFLLSPLIHTSASAHTLETFSEMGIAILLFIVGLHLSPREARSFGVSSFKVGLVQIISTGALGFLISQLFNFNLVSSFYISAAVTFSSTIIVLKLLSDKRDLEKLYSRISIGILLLQDIFAAAALIIASSFAQENINFISVTLPLLKGVLLGVFSFVVALKLLPKLMHFIAKSTELLFLFSLSWGFGIASLFSYLGLSMEIGALVAGVALSISPYSDEMSAKLKPLRDFFVVMFFILIGAQINLSLLGQIFIPLIVFVLFVVLVKPLIIMSLMGVLGYKKKTSFFTATSLAQISEFSLILGFLGMRLGHLDETVLALLTLLAVITIGLSTYLITHVEQLYSKLGNILKIFEKVNVSEEVDSLINYDVILFGCNRVGFDFIKQFKPYKHAFLCVDYDPDVIDELKKAGINCKFGDAEDFDFLEDLNIDESKMIISTIPEHETNTFLLHAIKHNPKVIAIMVSYSVDDALRLYDMGADYVILPHFIGGQMVSKMINKVGFDTLAFKEEKQHHKEYLLERKHLGHTHPEDLERFNF